MIKNNTDQWLCLELPVTPYEEAHKLQLKLVECRVRGHLKRNVLIILEHHPVYTAGKHGGRENIRDAASALSVSAIPFFETERGGNITYHGPGQVIAYPIVDLRELRLGISEYVNLLEDAMIRTAARWNIEASRNPVNHGVWVGPSKIGSIGLALRHGVVFHGIALNISCQLTPFSHINPCGLSNVSTTSMAVESGINVSVGDVIPVLKDNLSAIFQISFISTNPSKINDMIEGDSSFE